LRRSLVATLTLSGGALTPYPDLATGTLLLPRGGMLSVRRTQGKSVVVEVPGDGKPAHPLTPPSEEFIFGGAVAHDGRVAFSRGVSVSDVILVKAK